MSNHGLVKVRRLNTSVLNHPEPEITGWSRRWRKNRFLQIPYGV